MIRVIKRYESRKLYDTEESRYVSLEDISGWVRDGQEIQVIDNATSDDVTAQILTQVILDEGKRDKSSFLPTELLHELVRGGERLVANGLDKVQGHVEGLVRRGIDRLEPVRRAREEMVHLRERLADLERTLRTLEADSDGAAKPARKASARKSGTRTKKKAAAKPAAKKTAASAAQKEVVN